MQQETPQPELEAAYVTVAGRRVHYLHAGSGPPMLLLHGLVGSSENWQANLGALAQHSCVYALDLLNMGKSQRVVGLDAGLKATARRIVAFMDALDLPAADIVAHSHGGAVALMLAARHPHRVRRLILFAPANPYSRCCDGMVRTYSTVWGELAMRMLPYLPAPIQRRALGGMYGGPDRVVDRCLLEYSQVLRDSGSVAHVLKIVRGWFAERVRLRRVLSRVSRVPTLLVWGDVDFTMSLKSGIRLHRRLHASQLVVVRGYGHSVFEEAPEQANRIMLDWLARHPLPGPLPVQLPSSVPAPLLAPVAATVIASQQRRQASAAVAAQPSAPAPMESPSSGD